MVFLTTNQYRPSLTRRQDQFYLLVEISSFEVGGTSMILQQHIPPLGQEGEDWIGTIQKRVRIVSIARGVNYPGQVFLLFAGIIQDALYDPGHWGWLGKVQLHAYTAKMDRKLLNPRLQLPMVEKWRRTLPDTYVPNWNEISIKTRPQKEAGFLWSVYHKAVAVNKWRARIFGANADCTNYLGRERETILHRFHHCPKARAAWAYGLTILYLFLEIPQVQGLWPGLT
jgi:hypothetical protein